MSQRVVPIIPVRLALTQLFLIIKIHLSHGPITSCSWNTTTSSIDLLLLLQLLLLLWRLLLLLVLEMTPCLLLLLLLVVAWGCSRCCRGWRRSGALPGQHLHIIHAALKMCLACVL
jgi:hypothetical protein